MQKELTEIQKNILGFLIDQIKGKGIPPTLADVAKQFGYKNVQLYSSIYRRLRKRDTFVKVQNFRVE